MGLLDLVKVETGRSASLNLNKNANLSNTTFVTSEQKTKVSAIETNFLLLKKT